MNGVSQVINQASAAIGNAGTNISQALQWVGLLHLQDQQSGAILDAFQKQGFDSDPAMKALFSAAKSGPLGTKTAVLSVAQNYMNLANQISLLAAKRGVEGGGFVNPNAAARQQPRS